MNDFERAVARMVRDLPAEQLLGLVRARLVELGVIARPRPTEALRRELARRQGTPRRRRLPPSLELEAPTEGPRVLFSHDPVFGLPILVPPAGSPAGDAAPSPPAPVPLSPPTSEDAVPAANAVMVPADPPTPADSEVRLKRVHRAEVVQALVKRAAVEIVEAKRPTVVPCEWCGKLVAVGARGPIARHCRAPAPCSWRAHDAKFKAAVDARRVELRLAPPIIPSRVHLAPPPSPPLVGVVPPPRLPPAADSGAAPSTTPDPRGRAPQDGQRKTGAVPARAAGPVATTSSSPPASEESSRTAAGTARVPSPARVAASAQGGEGASTTPADSRAPRNVVHLFALREGPGERRSECRRYSDCLAGFVRGRGPAQTAHCPSDCRGFELIPRHAELARALAGGTSALAEVSQTRRERARDGKTSRGNAGPRWARRPIDEGDDLEDDHDETG